MLITFSSMTCLINPSWLGLYPPSDTSLMTIPKEILEKYPFEKYQWSLCPSYSNNLRNSSIYAWHQDHNRQKYTNLFGRNRQGSASLLLINIASSHFLIFSPQVWHFCLSKETIIDLKYHLPNAKLVGISIQTYLFWGYMLSQSHYINQLTDSLVLTYIAISTLA